MSASTPWLSSASGLLAMTFYGYGPIDESRTRSLMDEHRLLVVNLRTSSLRRTKCRLDRIASIAEDSGVTRADADGVPG